MIIRGYLSGHAAREYKAGKYNLCGVEMPNGMIENDAFPIPIITPLPKPKRAMMKIFLEKPSSTGALSVSLTTFNWKNTPGLFFKGEPRLPENRFDFGGYKIRIR